MANVIDTLIVELALDPTKFTAAQQQAIAAARQMTTQLLQQAKETEAAAARVAHYFETVKRAALGALGLFLGGRAVKDFVEETVKTEAAMARSARTIGVSTEQLAKWGAMARATGGDLQGVTGSLQGLSDRIAQAQITGDWGNLLQIFGRFGINLKTTKEGLVDIDDLLNQLNATFSKMDPVSARAILSMLGLDPSTINLLIMQRSEFLKLREEGEKVAKGIDENAKSAERLQRAWSGLVDVADRVATKAFGAIADKLVTIVDKAKELLGLALVDPGSREGEDIVERNRAEIRRRFGPSPLGPDFGPPLSILPPEPAGRPTSSRTPTSGALTPVEADVVAQRFADKIYNDRSLTPGQRVMAEPLPPGYAERLLAGGTGGAGGGGTTTSSTSSTNIGTVNVTISGAGSPEETGQAVYRWFQRFSHGASAYNGPH